MAAIAFLVAGFVVRSDLARKGEPPDLAWSIIAWGIVGGFVGARLLYIAEHWGTIDGEGGTLAALAARGGFTWYGGLLGGMLATAWPIRRAGVPWASAADSAALGMAIGYGIGRIGCHLAGDGDWGTPTTLPWGVAYARGITRWPHPPGVVVHPTPLYELVASAGIFGILWRLRPRLRPAGTLFGLYLVLAGVERLLVELVRDRTHRPAWLGLVEAQWTSLLLIGAGAVWLARRRSARPAVAGAPLS
jgi:phosphatidylglycerol:prolipoprotein diacylglycerol transferase